jgi:hypothetical protein
MYDDDAPSGTGPLLAGALTMAVFGLAGLLILSGLIFVVPKFARMFEEMQIELTAPTRLTLSASLVCRKFWFAVLPLAAILAALPWLIAKRHAWAIYVPATLLALLLAFVGFVSLFLPLVKIQQTLNKSAPPAAGKPEEDQAPRHPPEGAAAGGVMSSRAGETIVPMAPETFRTS